MILAHNWNSDCHWDDFEIIPSKRGLDKHNVNVLVSVLDNWLEKHAAPVALKAMENNKAHKYRGQEDYHPDLSFVLSGYQFKVE